MNEKLIADALRTRLLTLSHDVHLENAPENPDLPCLVYGQLVLPPVRTGQEPFSEHSGSLNVNVLTSKGSYATQGEDIAEEVSDLFPVDLRLSVDSGILRITAPALIQRGFDDGAYWAVPVSIPYLAHKT